MKNLYKLTLLGLSLVMTLPSYAACESAFVRQKPNSSYSSNSTNGTVFAYATQLQWQKCSLGQTFVPNTTPENSCTGSAATYSWKAALEAVQAANNANLLGNNNWRLPNKNELGSIVDRACTPTINANVFPQTPQVFYWTSSPAADDMSKAWAVGFNEGYLIRHYKGYLMSVRLVRDNPPG